jgi:hypothetical protein
MLWLNKLVCLNIGWTKMVASEKAPTYFAAAFNIAEKGYYID